MHICPNCGCNLAPLKPVELGNIAITDREEVVYEGQVIQLTKSQHQIVDALVRARGRGLTCGTLAARLGNDVNDSTIVKYVERVRQSFRAIDPAFDQVEALHGFGAYRWSARARILPAALGR